MHDFENLLLFFEMLLFMLKTSKSFDENNWLYTTCNNVDFGISKLRIQTFFL